MLLSIGIPRTPPIPSPMGDILDSVPLKPSQSRFLQLPTVTPKSWPGSPDRCATPTWTPSLTASSPSSPASPTATATPGPPSTPCAAWPSAPPGLYRAAIDRMEGLGILQVVERGWQRHPNRYRLGWAWSGGHGTLPVLPGTRNVAITNPPEHVYRADMSPQDPLRVPRDMEEERERIIDIVLNVLESLSLLPPGTGLTCPGEHKSGSYESSGTRKRQL